jgi:malate synthase
MNYQLAIYYTYRREVGKARHFWSGRFSNPDGKQYHLNVEIATLIVRPRGWHLFEKHIYVDGRRAPARSWTSACTCSTTMRR